MSADCVLNNWRVDVYAFTPKYGLLYNWYAATDARNIANTGWHVPTNDELNLLRTYLGGNTVAGGELKEVGDTYWGPPNEFATNSSLFNARGAGYRNSSLVWPPGTFSRIKRECRLYSATEYNSARGYCYELYNNTPAFEIPGIDLKSLGCSIRPIKDTTTLSNGQTGIYAGNDGKVYRTICIGTQEWLADNLCETLYRNGDPIPEVTDNAAWAALTTGAMCAYNNDWNNV